VCPCCDRPAKAYTAEMDWHMAKTLQNYFLRDAEHPGKFVRWAEVLQVGPHSSYNTSYSHLERWGLLERHPEKPGFRRITLEGKRFVRGITKVPRYLFIYRGDVLRTSVMSTKFDEAMTRKRNKHKAPA